MWSKFCRVWRVLWVVGVFVAVGGVQAGDWYVSPAGDNAAGNGSTTKPWREIRRALQAVRPGDTIHVSDGTYAGFSMDGVTGTDGKPIRIQASGDNARILATTDRRDNRDTISLNQCAWIVIAGLRASNANRAALRIEGGHHVTIRDCVFGDNTVWGILTGHVDDLLIENNDCFGSKEQHGIYVGNSGDRPVIRGNRTHGNAACGIHMNADRHMGGDGVISGARVENNVVWGNGRKGGAAINMDGVQDSVVRNNLLYDNHASGICCFRIDGAQGPKGLTILHNTIIMAADARYALQFSQTEGPIVVRNNIVYNLNGRRGGIAYFDAKTDPANVDSDYNIFSTEAPIVALDDWNTRHPLAHWQKLGHEPHSLVASLPELFADPQNQDFRPAAASPAIGKGGALPAEHDASRSRPTIGCGPLPAGK